jgi:hypothetical protein
MKNETYPQARKRLFRELKTYGAIVKDTLKVPQVKLNLGLDEVTLYFKPQAVYLEAHSLDIDIRSMKAEFLLGIVVATWEIRKSSNYYNY